MLRQCTFTIAGRPQRWQRPQQGRHIVTGAPMRFTDPQAEAAKKEIARLARAAWKGWPATGPVILRVIGIFEVPSSWPPQTKALAEQAQILHIADPDLDQLVKLAQDALVGIAYVDDNQVCGYPNAAKRYGSPERTEVTIQELDQPTEWHKTPAQRCPKETV
jgi:Holliday junction resolvase RusA-like endonuclease